MSTRCGDAESGRFPGTPPKEDPITEVHILVPVFSNEGERFRREHVGVFERHLGELFQGFSLLPGEGSGGWRMQDGTIKREPWRIYMVAVDLIGDGNKLRKAARFAAKHFRQETIFLRYLGLAETYPRLKKSH